MPHCRSCGAFVTPGFARVYGDNDDRIDGCIHRETGRSLRTGGPVDDGAADERGEGRR